MNRARPEKLTIKRRNTLQFKHDPMRLDSPMIFLESPNPFSKKASALHQETFTEKTARKALRSAIIARDIGLLQSCILNEGIEVNETINHATGERVIHLASKTTDCDFIIARHLIENMGADPECQDGYAMTPLLIAAEQANFGLLKYLAETKNCDLNAKNKDGAGVVHLAAQAGDVVLIQYLQSKCLSIDESDVTGCKPLDYARRNSNQEVIDYLEEMYEIIDF